MNPYQSPKSDLIEGVPWKDTTYVKAVVNISSVLFMMWTVALFSASVVAFAYTVQQGLYLYSICLFFAAIGFYRSMEKERNFLYER